MKVKRKILKLLFVAFVCGAIFAPSAYTGKLHFGIIDIIKKKVDELKEKVKKEKSKPPNTTNWTKYFGNPIVSVPSEVGGWGIADPCVIEDEDAPPEERYKMWYTKIIDPGITPFTPYYATSPDGIRWKSSKHNPALIVEKDKWDTWIETPFVLKDNDAPPEERYKLYYGGRGKPEDPAMYIGLATSPDGIHWKKYENNPVIKSLGHYVGISGPCVIRDNDASPNQRYKMWYDGWDKNGIVSISYATSPDGKNWTPYEKNPVLDVGEKNAWDSEWVAMPSVIKTNKGYELWYGGLSNVWDLSKRTGNIGYATSTDGIHWTKHPDNPILRHGEEWETNDIQMPSVILDQDMYKMWYVGLKFLGSSFEDGWYFQLGYATSVVQ